MNELLLLDKDFLKEMDEWNEREVYVKLVSLDFAEKPITEIEGSVTQGGITVDGSSTLRRTCNLTLITNNVNINLMDWSLRTKFRIYIGLKNYVNPEYDSIVWFKQGTFIITSMSSTLNNTGYTITIQGKDKMCLLNGDVGGSLFAAHDFGGIWTVDPATGDTIREDIPIKDIIKEAVHTYALEDYANIVINDLDGWSVDLLDFKAKNSVMWVYNILTSTGDWDTQIAFKNSSPLVSIFENAVEDPNLMPKADEPGDPFESNGRTYRLVKMVEYGQTAGYRATTLIYPDELVIAAGGTITQMLDKLVAMLGEFEYFYDTDGRFHFQRKQIYFNVAWNGAVTNEDEETYYEGAALSSANAYEFKRSLLIESFQNKPNVTNIRNDFSVWGTLKGTTTELPIHLRYAIDDKPQFYYSYSRQILYVSTELGITITSTVAENINNMIAASSSLQRLSETDSVERIKYVDWRELIYQMAVDNLQWHGRFEANRRELLNKGEKVVTSYVRALGVSSPVSEAQARSTYRKTWNTGYDAYYADMLAFWPQLYRTDRCVTNIYDDDGFYSWADMTAQLDTYGDSWGDTLEDDVYQTWCENYYWNPEYVTATKTSDGRVKASLVAPETLLFWIDFLDSYSELYDYKVSVIGRRPKVVSDKDVKAICYRETPLILFVSDSDEVPVDDMNMSYRRVWLTPAISNYFKISTQGKSAKDAMDTLIYEHTYYQDSITISAVPIYYLEPNTRIKVYDEESGINGEYIIKSISYQLAYDGMMSIQATRAATRII